MNNHRFLIFTSILLALVVGSWGVTLSWGAQRIPKEKWDTIVKTPAPPSNVSERNEDWFSVQKAKIERNKLILKLNKQK